MPNITTIFTHGPRGVLGIDDDGRLYWNGQRVVTEQKIKLSGIVNLAVILGGISTVFIAFFTALQYFKPR